MRLCRFILSNYLSISIINIIGTTGGLECFKCVGIFGCRAEDLDVIKCKKPEQICLVKYRDIAKKPINITQEMMKKKNGTRPPTKEEIAEFSFRMLNVPEMVILERGCGGPKVNGKHVAMNKCVFSPDLKTERCYCNMTNCNMDREMVLGKPDPDPIDENDEHEDHFVINDDIDEDTDEDDDGQNKILEVQIKNQDRDPNDSKPNKNKAAGDIMKDTGRDHHHAGQPCTIGSNLSLILIIAIAFFI